MWLPSKVALEGALQLILESVVEDAMVIEESVDEEMEGFRGVGDRKKGGG